jgi:hypothetical protein
MDKTLPLPVVDESADATNDRAASSILLAFRRAISASPVSPLIHQAGIFF